MRRKLEDARRVVSSQLCAVRPLTSPALPAMLRQELLMPKVTVLPANVSAEVDSGELLLDAGEKAGVEMEAGCFNCSCGTCAVDVVSGMENLSEPTPEELDVLDAWNKDPEKSRLTCCVKILKGDVVIKAGH
jgi:ferredoxin